MTFRSVAALQRANRACTACAEAGHAVVSAPVVEGVAGQRAYLYGQAPGPVEGVEGRPWRGRAGRTLRRWLDLDEDAFYGTFYCASITRCDPGRAPSGRGDRAPSRAEQALCARWREEELRLLRPALVVPVGGLAIAALLGPGPMTERIGERFPLGDAVCVPLPHPSGASGWTHVPRNRARLGRALELVGDELERL